MDERDGDPPKSRSHRAHVKSRRNRLAAPEHPHALPGSLQRMVVEVPRDEAPGHALALARDGPLVLPSDPVPVIWTSATSFRTKLKAKILAKAFCWTQTESAP